MRKVFLIVNNMVLNNIDYLTDELVDTKRLTRPLSIEGEEVAKKISLNESFSDVSSIYSSSFSSALQTAKYLSSKLSLTININKAFNERIIGKNNSKFSFQYFKETQEHDFDFKLPAGESFNDTKKRMNSALIKTLKINQDPYIAIFTHTMAVKALLSNYTDINYNLDDDLIINYNDKVICTDSVYTIIELCFNENLDLINIENININEN